MTNQLEIVMQKSHNYRGVTISDSFHISTKSLCDRCFNGLCEKSNITRCDSFTPAIKFKPPIRGFENQIFNTFRVGDSWSKKLYKGCKIALVNSKTNQVFMYAKVKIIFTGCKIEMANTHGKFNHNILALEITDNITLTLLKRLKNSSGSRAYEQSDKATVIYLEVIDGKEKTMDS